jgi:hypothetical protein
LPEWHGKGARPGSREQGRGTRGLSRNLGDPNCSTKKRWLEGGHGEEPETSGPVLILPLRSFTGDTNKEGGWWYRRTKATK